MHPDGCDEPLYCRYRGTAYCSVHYERARKNDGDPGPVERFLGRRGAGSINSNGYRLIFVGGRQRLEHHVVIENMLGRRLRPGETVHHRNGDRVDNRIANLEIWVRSHPSGQRVSDLADWLAREHPAALLAGDIVPFPVVDLPSVKPRRPAPKEIGPCSHPDGCSQPGTERHGRQVWCSMHRARLRKHGDPGPAERLTGQKGRGYVRRGYRIIRGRPEHALVMEAYLGRKLRPGETVHHRNGDRTDNRPQNLELWSRQHPPGQRVDDLVDWLARDHPAEFARARDKARRHHR
jgi:hypothetical protein